MRHRFSVFLVLIVVGGLLFLGCNDAVVDAPTDETDTEAPTPDNGDSHSDDDDESNKNGDDSEDETNEESEDESATWTVTFDGSVLITYQKDDVDGDLEEVRYFEEPDSLVIEASWPNDSDLPSVISYLLSDRYRIYRDEDDYINLEYDGTRIEGWILLFTFWSESSDATEELDQLYNSLNDVIQEKGDDSDEGWTFQPEDSVLVAEYGYSGEDIESTDGLEWMSYDAENSSLVYQAGAQTTHNLDQPYKFEQNDDGEIFFLRPNQDDSWQKEFRISSYDDAGDDEIEELFDSLTSIEEAGTVSERYATDAVRRVGLSP